MSSFAEITSNEELQQKLEEVYGDVDNIDVWVGGLSEDHVEGSNVGELFQAILVDQFTRLRDGDRFWYQNQFEGQELRRIEGTTLSDVISRNTDATNLQSNVFYDPSVLYVSVPDQGRASNLLVRVNENRIVVRDQRTGNVLHRVDTAGINKIVLVGSEMNSDRFELDLRETDQVAPLLIEVYGGVGGDDRLVVRSKTTESSSGADESGIQVNQIQIKSQEIERVSVRQQRTQRRQGGNDSQTIASQEQNQIELNQPIQNQKKSEGQSSAQNSGDDSSRSDSNGQQTENEAGAEDSSGVFGLFDSVFQSISDDLLSQ